MYFASWCLSFCTWGRQHSGGGGNSSPVQLLVFPFWALKANDRWALGSTVNSEDLENHGVYVGNWCTCLV